MPETTSLVKDERQAAFCAAFAQTGSINGAARLAKMSRDTHYKWVRAEKDGAGTGYLEALEDAKQQYRERLEDEIDRRAVEGIDEGVYYQGGLVGYQRRYSDNLLMFRAKAEMPEKYRDQYTVRHEGEINISALDAAIEQARQLKVINLEPQLIESGEGEENANG